MESQSLMSTVCSRNSGISVTSLQNIVLRSRTGSSAQASLILTEQSLQISLWDVLITEARITSSRLMTIHLSMCLSLSMTSDRSGLSRFWKTAV